MAQHNSSYIYSDFGILQKIGSTGMTFIKATRQRINWFGRVIGQGAYRFYLDDGFSRAASLAYTTLLALVPVTVICLLIFNAFGVDENQIQLSVDKILDQILPHAPERRIQEFLPGGNPQTHIDQLKILRDQLTQYFIDYSRNAHIFARTLNILSISALVFTGIALLNTIESALNRVWRVASTLGIFSKITNFWAVISLGPLLIVFSLYWTAKVKQLPESSAVFESNLFALFHYAVPVSITWIALTLLFYKLPAARVRLRDAAFGAIIGAILFEFVKRAFAYYISLSSGYSALYGVIATIPLFLFWLYLTWAVVMYAAEISYMAGSMDLLHGLQKYATDLGEIGGLLGLRILHYIAKSFLEGQQPPSEGEVAIETGSDPVIVRACLDLLTQANILTAADPKSHTRALMIAPDKLTIKEILLTFRSKKYRSDGMSTDQEQSNRETLFLEAMRSNPSPHNASQHVSMWSLADLVLASNSLHSKENKLLE